MQYTICNMRCCNFRMEKFPESKATKSSAIKSTKLWVKLVTLIFNINRNLLLSVRASGQAWIIWVMLADLQHFGDFGQGFGKIGWGRPTPFSKHVYFDVDQIILWPTLVEGCHVLCCVAIRWGSWTAGSIRRRAHCQ